MTYAEKLIQLRKEKGYESQNQFAIAVGLHSTHISGWENGKYNPSKQKLREIVSKLKLPQDYFIGCTPTPKPEKYKKKEPEPPRHMVIHHTPKKEVVINNNATIEPLAKLKQTFEYERNKIQRELISLTAQLDTYTCNIAEIDCMIQELKKGGAK